MNDRQSVPQEKHVHVLLHKGEKIIESIFPGIKDDLRNEGAVDIDLGKDTEWYQFGLWKKHYDIGLKSVFFSRRLLDNSIRKRISINPKITIQPESTVKDYLFKTENNNTKILGVKTSTPIGINDLFGDIVIDASGLGSRTSNLLSAIGLGEVTKEQIRTNLGYVSRLYRRKSEHGKSAIIVWSEPPKQKVLGLMMPIEGNHWMVSVGGWFSEFPKPEHEAFMEFAQRRLPVTNIYDRIKDFEPIGDICRYKLPGSQWNHYENLTQFPDGLLVIGGALCNINPFYGQGMTLCAIQAEIIRSHISDWTKGPFMQIISSHYLQSQYNFLGIWQKQKISVFLKLLVSVLFLRILLNGIALSLLVFQR